MTEPRWLIEARKHLGEKEIAGRKHNPQILQWWTLIRAGFTDDETPWCAAFVGGILESVGIKSSRSAAARSYLNWGAKLRKPELGCIVVFSRGTNNGHVAFYVGKDSKGNLLVLGGNQGNAVTIAAYPESRVLGYRWPAGEVVTRVPQKPKPPSADVPVPEPQEEEGGLSGTVKHWLNVVTTTVGTLFASLLDWKVAAVIAVVGLLIFCIIWFTHMRRQ